MKTKTNAGKYRGLGQIGQQLLEITDECRPDMHEPDEQNVSAIVIGTRLDNAFGNAIDGGKIRNGTQEMVLILTRTDPHMVYSFNVADLIALARAGAGGYGVENL